MLPWLRKRLSPGRPRTLSRPWPRLVVDYVRVYQKPVSALADVVTTEGTSTAALPFTVTQKDGATTNVSVTSSNTDVLPAGNLVLGGSGEVAIANQSV